MPKTIGNPLSWAAASVGNAFGYAASVTDTMDTPDLTALPQVRTLTVQDLKTALRKGMADMGEFRSDVVIACLLYPVIGIVLAVIALQGNMAQLLFPVLSGFALVGPVASIGLYEMSRQHEAGQPVKWFVLGDLVRSPNFGSILALSVGLLGLFLAWILSANFIYALTLGPERPLSAMALMTDAFTTGEGWAMIIVGMGVGALFAAAVLTVSIVAFPLLLDRRVGLAGAIITSVRVTRANPRVIAIWGLIVAVGLTLGTIPFLLGLLVVLPILGHATWHLYRAAVV